MSDSIWHSTSKSPGFERQSGELRTDVAIVGAGITGLTAAMLLARSGLRVAVLEAGEVGGGTTSDSTGNLYVMLDQGFAAIRKKWGDDAAREVVASRTAAIDLIEATAQHLSIDCNFARRGWNYFAPPDSDQAKDAVRKEYEACQALGIEARITDSLPLPVPLHSALVVEGQAQFHPARYLHGLAAAIASPECMIFEHSRVISIDPDEGLLKTAQGEVSARKIFIATHSPVGVQVVHMEMSVYREYGLAGRLSGAPMPEGIYWSAAETLSIRGYQDEQPCLVLVGGKHPTGHEGDRNQSYYERLEHFARDAYGLEHLDYRWSAQHYRPADGLPYIGENLKQPEVYIATGYATDGLVYGTLAGIMIADAIIGKQNRWRDLYRPSRLTPVKSAKNIAKENINVTKHLVKDYVLGPPEGRFQDVGPGEGKVLEIGKQKLAVSRSGDGKITAVSAACTHMGCLVDWNGAEGTWDCPCHGSRFTAEGEVIEGPAMTALQKVDPASL